MHVTRWKTAIVLSILAFGASGSTAGVIYVDANATGLNNGSSWANAYRCLQDALADANTAIRPVEVRVAQGVYRPDQGRLVKSGDKMAVFPLKNGVSIMGGFAGVLRADPNARDPNACPTTLSGDLKGDDVWTDMTIDVPYEVAQSHLDNSACVVDAENSGPTAILDGVQIKGVWYTEGEVRSLPGYIDKSRQGGLFVDSGYPTIRNCVFTENLSCSVKNVNHGNPTFTGCRFIHNHSNYSAALFTNVSNATISQCTFEDNVAKEGGAMVCANGEATIVDSAFLHNVAWQFAWDGGGAILNWGSKIGLTRCNFRNNATSSHGGALAGMIGTAEATLVDCTFYYNTASAGNGGAMYGGKATIKGCDFQFNTAAEGWGGAIEASCVLITDSVFAANQAVSGGVIDTYGRDLLIENCVFAGNKSKDNGAAIKFGGPATLTINHCSLQGNRSARGNALDASFSNVMIKDSIIWDANAFSGYKTELAITYSDIYDPCGGIGNFSADPYFARLGYWDPNGTPADANDDFWVDGDYHLKSQAGRWDPNSQSWVLDAVTSPCIDAGDPNSPVGDEPVPNGGRINIGAYGGTAEASKSPYGGASIMWYNSTIWKGWSDLPERRPRGTGR